MIQNLYVGQLGLSNRKPNPLPYSDLALWEELKRLKQAWQTFQRTRDRNAVYDFLSTIFATVSWWTAEGKAVGRVRRTLDMKGFKSPKEIEPFAALMVAASAPQVIDRRTLSKWSRGLRYAAAVKLHSEPLPRFLQRKGGLNVCAAHFARRRRRGRSSGEEGAR